MLVPATIFALILLSVGIALILRIRRLYETRDDDVRADGREHLREFYRMRRQRDRVWLRIDEMYAQFTKSSSTQKQLPGVAGEPESQVGKSRMGEQSCAGLTKSDIEEKFRLFMKKG